MMENISGLLNLNIDLLTNFSLQSRDVDNDVEIDRLLRNHEKRLKAVAETLPADTHCPKFNPQSVEALITKVFKGAAANVTDFSLTELRMMGYYLSRFHSDRMVFGYAIGLLDGNWRDMYINGLLFYLMNSWTISPEYSRTSVCAMLKRRLSSYTGAVKKYHQLKQRLDFLDPSGPARLLRLLLAKKLLISEVPILLGFRQSALSFPYFSDVIIDYFRKTSMSHYDAIEQILKGAHPLDRTRKLLYAHMIEDADNQDDGGLQADVTRSAHRVMGDVNLSSTWAPFPGATAEEKKLLRKAQDLVCAWAARKSVEAFFDICVQDARRRECWLEYVQNVADFRIVGSDLTRTRLQSNPNVAPLLESKFIQTKSRVSTTSALVLFMREKVFVEFSNIGSLYIYNFTHDVVKGIKNKRFIDSTDDLKSPYMGMAIEKLQWDHYIYADEGKIYHKGEWESRFRRWMLNKMTVHPGEKQEYAAPLIEEETIVPDMEESVFEGITVRTVFSPVKTNTTLSQPSLFDDL